MTNPKHKSSERKNENKNIEDSIITKTDLNLSDDQIERRVESTVGSFAIEGMTATEENKEHIRQVLRGERSAREIADELIKKYRDENNYSG